MILATLILGHLIADYLLQPRSLVLKKIRQKLGIFEHVLIHFATLSVLCINIFTQKSVFLSIILICVAHFIIDSSKINFEKKNQNYAISYWLDQLLHYFCIIAVYFLFIYGRIENFVSILPIQLIIYFTGLIFFTLTIEIGFCQEQRALSHSNSNSIVDVKLNKLNMFTRAIYFTGFYIILALICSVSLH